MKIEVSNGTRIVTPGVDLAHSAAGEAIRLRLLVREALEGDDRRALYRLNQVADAAYARLEPEDARIYLDWIRDDIPSVADLFGGGDA